MERKDLENKVLLKQKEWGVSFGWQVVATISKGSHKAVIKIKDGNKNHYDITIDGIEGFDTAKSESEAKQKANKLLEDISSGKLGAPISGVSLATGKILWWDERDGNGIVKDSNGNEWYIDTSVIKSGTPARGKTCDFDPNPTAGYKYGTKNVRIK